MWIKTFLNGILDYMRRKLQFKLGYQEKKSFPLQQFWTDFGFVWWYFACLCTRYFACLPITEILRILWEISESACSPFFFYHYLLFSEIMGCAAPIAFLFDSQLRIFDFVPLLIIAYSILAMVYEDDENYS